jgi:hypothetical protein
MLHLISLNHGEVILQFSFALLGLASLLLLKQGNQIYQPNY